MSISGKDIFVKAGELIRQGPFQAIGKAVDALRLKAGFGVRLSETPDGTIINFDGKPVIFNHPFKVSLSGDGEAKILPGLVNTVQATIKKVPLDGDKKNPPPTLKFPRLRLDKTGRGWIAAEVTFSPLDWSVLSAEVVQVADLDTDTGEAPEEGTARRASSGGVPNLPGRRGRYPLAMLRRTASGELRQIQSAYFNVQHRLKIGLDPANDDLARHFFYPA